MNAKDAAVYKILADMGFDVADGVEIPNPLKDKTIQQLVDPDQQFLDDIKKLFDKPQEN